MHTFIHILPESLLEFSRGYLFWQCLQTFAILAASQVQTKVCFWKHLKSDGVTNILLVSNNCDWVGFRKPNRKFKKIAASVCPKQQLWSALKSLSLFFSLNLCLCSVISWRLHDAPRLWVFKEWTGADEHGLLWSPPLFHHQSRNCYLLGTGAAVYRSKKQVQSFTKRSASGTCLGQVWWSLQSLGGRNSCSGLYS